LHSPFACRFYIGELLKASLVERVLDRKSKILDSRTGSVTNSLYVILCIPSLLQSSVFPSVQYLTVLSHLIISQKFISDTYFCTPYSLLSCFYYHYLDFSQPFFCKKKGNVSFELAYVGGRGQLSEGHLFLDKLLAVSETKGDVHTLHRLSDPLF
jgi:hypothetical protein